MADRRPIILFDVDKTLINTGSLFKESILSALQKSLSISSEELLAREAEYKKNLEKYTDFEPISFLQHITQQADVSALAAETVFNRHFVEQSLFDDVLPALAELSEHFRLGIYSEANKEWQQKKLDLAGIHHLFEPELVFIWRRKTDSEQLKQLPPKCTIVDDNTEVIGVLQTVPTVTPIWINRLGKPPLPDVLTVTTLLDIKKVITTN